jgi:formylglycine-generating enzyme required for sulfatase activity
LSELTGREYRLPSEAQWEYACRAKPSPPAPLPKGEGGKKIYSPFHFGETISTELANYNGNYTYGIGEKGEYREETTPVGHYKVANEFGLYDMHGNVWEWCEDDWHDNYKGAPTDGSAWIDVKSKESNKTSHPLRGGSWISNPHFARSAYRDPYNLVSRGNNIGFRVISSAPGLT